ncbi:MAG: polysaccharide biosynthesis tyrosine autokinase [Tunicatimonas sp.]
MNNSFDPDATSINNKVGADIDLTKVWLTVRKKAGWLLLFLLLTNLAAYLYVRYTRPVYESHSVLKLNVKSEANILGLNTVTQGLDDLAGEIELLKSNLFFSKVVNAADLAVSYYAYGRVLFQERYQNSPFRVEHTIKNPAFYDRPIDLEIINRDQYVLAYPDGGEVLTRAYRFGEVVETPDYRLVVRLTNNYAEGRDEGTYYFTVNSDRALVSYLGSNMTVEPVNFNAKTIRIGFEGYNQKKVRDLVHLIDSVYLKYTQEQKNLATQQKITFLDEQLSSIEQRLSTYESYFENFTITNQTNDLPSAIGEAIAQLKELELRKLSLQQTQAAVADLSEQVENEELIFTGPAAFTDYPEDLSAYVEQLNQLLNERALLMQSYKESSHALKLKDQKVALLKKDISQLLSAYRSQLTQAIQKVDRTEREVEQKFVQLPAQGTQYDKNQRYFNLYEQVYLSLMQTKNELEIARAGTVTDFVVLLPATLPGAPIAPERLMVQAAGLVSGLLLCLLFVSLSYVLNDRINSQSELERYVNAPILGTIPFYRRVRTRGSTLVVRDSPKSAISEAFRTVRTNLQFVGAQQQQRIISVTSTVGSEGKTFVATNLGNVIALSGKKVVLIDVDLRKPKVHLAFGDTNTSRGVSNVLIGDHPVEECIVKTDIENLDYIPAGSLPPNPAELIASAPFDALLNDLKSRYDVVIVDTPPVGLVTDGALMMKKADLPLYVFRADYSRRVFANTLNRIKQSQGLSKLAVIFNGMDTTATRGYSYEKYGYGYYEMESEDRPWWRRWRR